MTPDLPETMSVTRSDHFNSQRTESSVLQSAELQLPPGETLSDRVKGKNISMFPPVRIFRHPYLGFPLPAPVQPDQDQAEPPSQCHVSDSISSRPAVHVSEVMKLEMKLFSDRDSISAKFAPTISVFLQISSMLHVF